MSDKGMVVPGVEMEFDREFDDIQFDLQEVHALLADALFKLGRRDILKPLRDALETGQRWLVEEANRRIAESEYDTKPNPESELLHWGRDEEFRNPTGLFEVEFGGDLRYWVSAEGAAEALMMVKTNGEDLMGETLPEGASVEVKSLSLDEANALTFQTERERTTMAAEFNRDPRPRVIACSEWTP